MKGIISELLNATSTPFRRVAALIVVGLLSGIGAAASQPTLAVSPAQARTIQATTSTFYLPLARYTACSPPAGASYCVTDLGTSGQNSEATTINNLGQVAGVVHIPYLRGYITHAALVQNGKLVDLHLSDQVSASWAAAIDDAGQIVGWSNNRAFAWSTQIGLRDLGALGDAQGFAFSINNNGAIVGSSWPRALLWQGDQMIQLDTLPGFSSSQARDINASGQTVGIAESSTTNPNGTPVTHAVRWDNGTVADLGVPDGYLGTRAFALNDAGQVVGSLTTTETAPNTLYLDRAASWQNGIWRDLGTLAAHTSSRALDINAAGQIVGSAETTKSNGQGGRVSHGVLWQNNALIDLNSRIDPQSGWEILSANAIDDRGRIVGQGIIGGARHAMLLTPAS